jgi:hypothetical protein
VEDIMDATLGWQHQSVGDTIDVSQHLKWPIKLWCEVPSCFVGQRGRQVVMKAQPHLVSYKFQLLVVVIIGALHQVMGMLQLILDLHQELIVIHE